MPLSLPGFRITDGPCSLLNLTAALAAFSREGDELRFRLIVERVLQDVGQPRLTLGYPPRVVDGTGSRRGSFRTSFRTFKRLYYALLIIYIYDKT